MNTFYNKCVARRRKFCKKQKGTRGDEKMKETVGTILCVIAIALMCLGDQSFSRHASVAEETITPQVSEAVSVVIPTESVPSEGNETVSELSFEQEISSDIQDILPDSLYWDFENEAIKYVTPDTSIRVYFPDIFCYVQEDKPSEDGICLSTKDGKASIMIGTMSAENITPVQLVEYLKNEYTDSTVYLTDNKDIVCIYDTIDDEGKAWTYFLSVRIREYDYFEVAVMCPTAEKARYSNIFSRIKITSLRY